MNVFIVSLKNSEKDSEKFLHFLQKTFKNDNKKFYTISYAVLLTCLNKDKYIMSRLALDEDADYPRYQFNHGDKIILLQTTENLTIAEQNFLKSFNKEDYLTIAFNKNFHKYIAIKKVNPYKKIADWLNGF